MTERAEPELGQMCFGNPISEYECPSHIEAGLILLVENIAISEWNRTGEEFEAPTDNNAASYSTDIFEMCAYYWGDKPELKMRPNFKCGDFEVRWYKYLGRGMSMNADIDANEFFKIIDRCVASIPDYCGEYL